MKIKQESLNLIGIKHGKLTPIKIIKNQNNRSYFLCKCDCGNEKIIQIGHIKFGHVKSCGCNRSRLEDLSGEKFGTLVVLERAPNKSKQTYWKCKCDCGLIKNVSAARLKGGIESCGCLHPHKRIKCDEYYFNNDNNLEALYWAGFIAADGYILKHKPSLSILIKKSRFNAFE